MRGLRIRAPRSMLYEGLLGGSRDFQEDLRLQPHSVLLRGFRGMVQARASKLFPKEFLLLLGGLPQVPVPRTR